MKDTILFQIAFGLTHPWVVESVSLDTAEKQLNIYLNFYRGSKFTCPQRGAEGQKVHDTIEKTWRHLNFFHKQTTSDAGAELVA